jgi:hypothetical protein
MSEPEAPVVIVESKSAAAPEVQSVGDLIEHPAKVMRIGTMIKQLLEEVRAAPLDDASRNRLKEVHARSISELSAGLAPDLRSELDRLTLPFTDGTPSDGELRIAHAQLVGWLEGLFHGIQAALFAQQATARAMQEAQAQRALPPGSAPGPTMSPPGSRSRPGSRPRIRRRAVPTCNRPAARQADAPARFESSCCRAVP